MNSFFSFFKHLFLLELPSAMAVVTQPDWKLEIQHTLNNLPTYRRVSIHDYPGDRKTKTLLKKYVEEDSNFSFLGHDFVTDRSDCTPENLLPQMIGGNCCDAVQIKQKCVVELGNDNSLIGGLLFRQPHSWYFEYNLYDIIEDHAGYCLKVILKRRAIIPNECPNCSSESWILLDNNTCDECDADIVLKNYPECVTLADKIFYIVEYEKETGKSVWANEEL
jgi:hypothetical protein